MTRALTGLCGRHCIQDSMHPRFFPSPVWGPLSSPRERPRMTPVPTSGETCRTAGHAHRSTRGCPLGLTPPRQSSRPAHVGAQCPAQVCLEQAVGLNSSLKAPSWCLGFTRREFHPATPWEQARVSHMLRVCSYTTGGSEITTCQ